MTCTRCSSREARYGQRMCAGCLEYHRKWRANRVRNRTAREVARARRRYVERYWERKLAGLCPRCGEPAGEETVLCDEHAREQRERQRKQP